MIAKVVSAVGPQYGENTINEMEKLVSAKGIKVTCDAIVVKLCKVWRVSGSGKGIVKDPSETELVNIEYFAKDKACFYCEEKGHLKNKCSEFTGKQHRKNCEHPGCTMKVGHITDNGGKIQRTKRIDLQFG